ncbi:hypothetical protein JCM11641_005488 [Rhodosporidiobolus odoratus]
MPPRRHPPEAHQLETNGSNVAQASFFIADCLRTAARDLDAVQRSPQARPNGCVYAGQRYLWLRRVPTNPDELSNFFTRPQETGDASTHENIEDSRLLPAPRDFLQPPIGQITPCVLDAQLLPPLKPHEIGCWAENIETISLQTAASPSSAHSCDIPTAPLNLVFLCTQLYLNKDHPDLVVRFTFALHVLLTLAYDDSMHYGLDAAHFMRIMHQLAPPLPAQYVWGETLAAMFTLPGARSILHGFAFATAMEICDAKRLSRHFQNEPGAPTGVRGLTESIHGSLLKAQDLMQLYLNSLQTRPQNSLQKHVENPFSPVPRRRW